MTTLAVDKIKKKVTLGLSDQAQISGYLYLSPFSELGVGRQTILDALTGVDRFIPFESNGGEFSFINQDHVVWLASAMEKDPDEIVAPPERRSVTVFIQGGKRLRGDLIVAIPEEKGRLSDLLNESKNFLVLRDEKREVLVNVDYVIRVV